MVRHPWKLLQNRPSLLKAWWCLIIYFAPCLLGSVAASHCDVKPHFFKERPLTLFELSDIALRCNPSTSLAWATVRVSLASLGIAYAPYWPQLAGDVNLSKIHNISGSKSSITPNVNQWSYSPALSLNYLLLDFGTRAYNAQAADFQLQAAKLNCHEAFQQVILQVEQAYYQVLAQKALMDAYQLSLQEAKKNLAMTQALRSQGLNTIGDVYQAQSALEQANLNLQQTLGAWKIAQGQLAAAIGVSVATEIPLVALPLELKTQPFVQKIDKLLLLAKKTRPDLLAAEAQFRAAQAQLGSVKAAQWPTLNLGSNVQRTYPRTTINGGFTSSIFLVVNLPIFSGFQPTYALHQAYALKDQAKAQLKILSQQVEVAVWQAYFNLKTTQESLESNQALLKSSLQAFEQSCGQYKAGVGNILTVLTTQATLANARAQLIQAKVNWYTALAQLAAALGTLKFYPGYR